MSINTLGNHTSIALGALFGGWFADTFEVDSAVWFGVALASAALLVAVGTRRKCPSIISPTGSTTGSA